MPAKPQPVKVSQDYVVTVPPVREALAVVNSDWDELKSRIGHIDSSVSFFQNLGWSLLGVAATALFTGVGACISQPETLWWARWLCFALGATSLVSGSLSLYFSRRLRHVTAQQKDDVLHEMHRIEERSGRREPVAQDGRATSHMASGR